MKSYADNAQNFLKSMNKKQRDKFVMNVANKIEKTVKSSKDYEDPDEQGGFKYHMYFDDDTITDAFIVELENNGIRYPIEQHNANADIIDKSLTGYVNNALGDIGNEKISGRSKTVSDWEKNILRLEVGGSKGDWYINAKASSKISNLETDTMYSMLGDYATKDAHEHYDIMSEVDELLYSKGIYLYD